MHKKWALKVLAGIIREVDKDGIKVWNGILHIKDIEDIVYVLDSKLKKQIELDNKEDKYADVGATSVQNVIDDGTPINFVDSCLDYLYKVDHTCLHMVHYKKSHHPTQENYIIANVCNRVSMSHIKFS